MMETLYRTKTPQSFAWIEPCFELTIGEQTVDNQPGYFVRETHCWWDAAAKRAVRIQYILSPREGFATLEEAHERYQLQRTARARRGFVHSFAPRYEATKRSTYLRIEITPQETVQETCDDDEMKG